MANYAFNIPENLTEVERSNYIPTKILEKNLMSDTSEAYDCFASQQFSAKLQAFMINYVITVSSQYSIYV